MGLITAVPPVAATTSQDPLEGRLRRRAALALPALAVASLVTNIVVVGTGGAVRLTASGLGCPTWPQCGDGAYVAQPEYGVHGAIEFGNRLLTFVLVAVVAATLVASVGARRSLPGVLAPAVLGFVGIPAQAVIGGISVLTHLNPWVVMVHFVASCALVAVSTVLVLRTRPGAVRTAGTSWGPRRWVGPPALRVLSWLVGLVTAAVVCVGVVVTGSGPHAGDLQARRTGLAPAAVSQVHADVVMLLLGLTVGLVVAVRVLPRDSRPARAARASAALLAIEAAQAFVGAVQYATGLPVALVDLHLVGAAGVVAVTVWAVLSLREPSPAPTSASQPVLTR